MPQIFDARPQPVQKQKKSDLEKIAEALSLAQSAFGIAGSAVTIKTALANQKILQDQEARAVKTNEAADAAAEVAKAELARKASGTLNPGELQDVLLAGKFTEAPFGPPAPGAIPIKVKDGETVIPKFLVPAQDPLTAKENREFELKEMEITGKKKEGASKLRDEWLKNPLTKGTQEVATAYEKVSSAGQDPSAAGDISLIFGYMKMLDPGSTVREGEFATAQNAAGVPDIIKNMYNKITTGERLNPAQRQDFIGSAKKVYDAQIRQQEKFNKEFVGLSNKSDIDPSEVVLSGLFQVQSNNNKESPEKPKTTNNIVAGQIIKSAGKTYKVGPAGELTEVK